MQIFVQKFCGYLSTNSIAIKVLLILGRVYVEISGNLKFVHNNYKYLSLTKCGVSVKTGAPSILGQGSNGCAFTNIL